TMELVAPESGVLSEILKGEGEKVEIGETIGRVTSGGAAQAATPRPSTTPTAAPRPAVSQPAPAAVAPLSPAVRRLVEEHAVNPTEVTATGRGGRLTKGDVLQHLEAKAPQESAPTLVQARPRPVAVPPSTPTPVARPAVSPHVIAGAEPRERREPMSRIRRRI